MLEQIRDSAILNPAAGTAEGMTEPRRQAALLKTGALHNAIFNSGIFSFIATDEKGIIQLFNIGAERMLGYTAAEVVNKISPSNFHDPQEVMAHAQVLSLELTPIASSFEALAYPASRGIEDSYDLTYIRKDGSRFPAIVSVTALRDEYGDSIGYLLIGTDISQRKQSEGALRASEERYRALFESIDEGFCIIEKLDGAAGEPLDFRFVEANPAFAVQSGLSGVVGKTLRQVIPDEFEEWHLTYDTVLRTGEPVRFERGLVSQGRVLELHAFRVEDETHRRVGVNFKDITKRKQAEQALRASEERYRNLFDSIDEGFCVIEMIFDEHDKPVDYRFLEVNPSFEKQSGIHEGAGKRMRELAPDHEAHWFEIYGKVALTGEPVRFVNEAKMLDGRWFDVYAFRVDGRDSNKVAVLFTDITERKQFELNLNNAIAVAENASLAKSDFLSSMSHELRSPLNAILGFAQLMESGSPLPTPTQKANLDQILKAGWYLLELINEILDLAHIESGKLSLSLEPMSLSEVLLDCRAMIEPQAQKSGTLMHFPQFDRPYIVKADRTRVKQVLINLLSNAIKYNRAGGSVELTCSASTAKRIRISVQDTGEGLPPEKLAQLFQPFNRLGQETSVKEGTGIGLVVSKQLVELMGGEIGVESTVGVGSVFWIELNLAAKAQSAADAAEPLAPSQARVTHGTALRTLLYVEDNRANMQLVEQLIVRRPDMLLLSACDGNLGITLARDHLPDVILMDINLPGISGMQALKILREDPLTAHIPVLALSANAMPRDIEKGLQAGFFRYLTKPIKVNEFMEALDMALALAETEFDGAVMPGAL